jgi:hypothetical protein
MPLFASLLDRDGLGIPLYCRQLPFGGARNPVEIALAAIAVGVSCRDTRGKWAGSGIPLVVEHTRATGVHNRTGTRGSYLSLRIGSHTLANRRALSWGILVAEMG